MLPSGQNSLTARRSRCVSDLFRVGWRSLAIGIAVLAVSIELSQIVRAILPKWALAQRFAEGVMIFGWVANLAPRRDPALRGLGRPPTSRPLPPSRQRSSRTRAVLRNRRCSAANRGLTLARRRTCCRTFFGCGAVLIALDLCHCDIPFRRSPRPCLAACLAPPFPLHAH